MLPYEKLGFSFIVCIVLPTLHIQDKIHRRAGAMQAIAFFVSSKPDKKLFIKNRKWCSIFVHIIILARIIEPIIYCIIAEKRKNTRFFYNQKASSKSVAKIS